MHGSYATAGAVHLPLSLLKLGPYGRLFPHLPPHEPDGANEEARLASLKRQAAILAAPADARVRANPGVPAGYTFFGQFLAHDLSFDPSSLGQRNKDPERLEDFRTPRMDLDLLYGGGPRQQPFFYRQPKKKDAPWRAAQFETSEWAEEPGGKHRGSRVIADLARSSTGVALIPDPRQDSTIVLSQMHLGFQRFHNRVVAELAAGRAADPMEVFEQARRITTWHYQWLIVNDYLPRIVDDPARVAAAVKKPRQDLLLRWKVTPFLPIEFTAAAFRFGHSTILPCYRVNATAEPRPLFGRKRDSLTGHRALPSGLQVVWEHLLELDGHTNGHCQPSRCISHTIVGSVVELPPHLDGGNLIERDLVRGWRLGLPSGQNVARSLGQEGMAQTLRGNHSLWYFILLEAEETSQGKRLGPVGSTIVVETLIALLRADHESYLAIQPEWNPGVFLRRKSFDLAKLFRYARMPMTEAP